MPHLRINPRKLFAKELGAFKTDSMKPLMDEIGNAPKLDGYIAQIPKSMALMVTYLDNDDFIYRKLTPQLQQELEQRWRQKRPDTTIRWDCGTHLYSNDIREMFTAPEFDEFIEETAKLFLTAL